LTPASTSFFHRLDKRSVDGWDKPGHDGVERSRTDARPAADREKIAACLIERRETVAIAESSTGGLIASALLAVPGASAYFVGGAIVYTKTSRAALLGIGDADMQGLRPATEAYASLLARRVSERLGATWGLAETGAAGPGGNRYGDPAGHTCLAVAGAAERAATLRTGSADRQANMDAFARRALELLLEAVSAKG
jgi:nicotinamide-nucleotide amidase